MKTKEFTYQDWQMIVHKDGTIEVTKLGETREYKISEPMSRIEQEKDYLEYVRIDVQDDKIGYYLFKFEDEDFFVGDIWSEDNEHIEEFAMHVFGEECLDEDEGIEYPSIEDDSAEESYRKIQEDPKKNIPSSALIRAIMEGKFPPKK